MTILRTEFDGTYEIAECHWGRYLRQCRDPLATDVIKEENLNHFEVNPEAHKIPSDIWSAWIMLCFHYVDKVPQRMEVLVRFLRSESDPSQFMAIIPKQTVAHAAADSRDFSESCNLLTGERYTSYPPEGYIPVGSSHSHNTMGAGWSSHDNNSEIPDPGIHLTIGSINTKTREYRIAASVTANLRRFVVDFNHLIDAEIQTGTTFHENVLEYVDIEPVKTYQQPNVVHHKFRSKTKYLPPARKNRDHFDNMEEYYNQLYRDYFKHEVADPFYYSETSSKIQPIEAHNILDWLDDYIKGNYNDTNALEELKEQLSSRLIDLELTLAS
jgi:hypothetical protein